MAFNEGFNFRGTLAFVTDPADTQFPGPDAAEAYPITAGGVTFGWGSTDSPNQDGAAQRDRNAGNDPRLAGMNYATTDRYWFRVDLPAPGNYELRWAVGEASYAVSSVYYRVLDDATVLLSVANVSTSAANRFLDATGVERNSSADWVANNASVTYAFASTILYFEIGNAASSGYSPIAHLQIVQLPDATYTAFQGSQSDAFQGPAGYVQNERRTAFQQNAFQSNAFQIYGGTVVGDVNVAANSSALTLTSFAATVSFDRNIATTSGALTLTTFAASVALNINVAAASAALTLTAFAASVTFDRNVSAASAALTLTSFAATISYSRNVLASSAALTLTAAKATVSYVPNERRTAFQQNAFQSDAFQIFGGAVEDIPGGPGPRPAARRRVRQDDEIILLVKDRILAEDELIMKVIKEFLDQRPIE